MIIKKTTSWKPFAGWHIQSFLVLKQSWIFLIIIYNSEWVYPKIYKYIWTWVIAFVHQTELTTPIHATGMQNGKKMKTTIQSQRISWSLIGSIYYQPIRVCGIWFKSSRQRTWLTSRSPGNGHTDPGFSLLPIAYGSWKWNKPGKREKETGPHRWARWKHNKNVITPSSNSALSLPLKLFWLTMTNLIQCNILDMCII